MSNTPQAMKISGENIGPGMMLKFLWILDYILLCIGKTERESSRARERKSSRARELESQHAKFMLVSLD